ncbi:MAG: hypothetical protein CMQ36_04510 [Gammaproteobacteria bacterium]|nr:hypothetical protein [Gammaproteobacteria bacterium]
MSMEPIFDEYAFTEDDRREMDRVGHFLFPGLLTEPTRDRLIESMRHVIDQGKRAVKGHEPQRFSAEFDDYLESLIGHPQMLGLARCILGNEIRYDHCVSLVRPAGTPAMGWHSHEYSEDDPKLGLLRIFFYVSGFEPDDGGLKVVPGSHLYRDKGIRAGDDEELLAGWLSGKTHPDTGDPLAISHLSAIPGSVIVMWTHAAHGVSVRRSDSSTRYCIVYAYRNPGRPSEARWISDAFEAQPTIGAEGLKALY